MNRFEPNLISERNQTNWIVWFWRSTKHIRIWLLKSAGYGFLVPGIFAAWNSSGFKRTEGTRTDEFARGWNWRAEASRPDIRLRSLQWLRWLRPTWELEEASARWKWWATISQADANWTTSIHNSYESCMPFSDIMLWYQVFYSNIYVDSTTALRSPERNQMAWHGCITKAPQMFDDEWIAVD